MSRKKAKPQTGNPLSKPLIKSNSGTKWQWIFIGIVVFLLYANTLSHDYAQDDAIVITQNSFTQKGFKGIGDLLSKESFVGYFNQQKSLLAGSRYRPLSLITFAIEIEFFGANPGISHFTNVLLYAITCILLYLVLLRMLSAGPWKTFQGTLPYLTALIFAVHPVHTEAVANIKGRDEILCLLLGLLTLYWLFGFIKNQKPLLLFLAGFAYFLALLSKESAYTFVFIFPAALWVFTKIENRKVITLGSLFFGIAIIGWLMRTWAVGTVMNEGLPELMNNPFLYASMSEKLATISLVLGKYFLLVLFPYPLTHDYYPYQINLANWGDIPVILSILLYVSLAIIAIRGIIRKKITGFGIWFFLGTIAIVSNIFFPVGTFMNERFLFIPSVGLLMLLSMIIIQMPVYFHKANADYKSTISNTNIIAFANSFRKKNPIGTLLLAVIVFTFCFLTVQRNPAWKNNETLFLTDIHTSGNSAKMNNAAGGVLFELSQKETDPTKKTKQLEQSFQYLTKAVTIHPTYQPAWITLGNVYYFLYKDYTNAINSYLNAGGNDAMRNLLLVGQKALRDKDYTNAIKCFNIYVEQKPGDPIGYIEAGNAYLEGNHADEAIKILKKALEIFPSNDALYNKLGLAYGKGKNDLQSSIFYLQKSVEINPANAESYENLGVAYAMGGNPQESIRYFELAIKYNPTYAKLYDNIGNVYMQLGEESKANEYFAKARNLSGN